MHLYHSTWSIYYIFSCEDVLLLVLLAKKNICEEDGSPIWMWHSAKESSCIFHWLLVDSCLIGINTLNVGAPGEGHCSVLIVTFAITQDGVPGVSIPEKAPCFFIRQDESTHINVTKTPLLPQACFLSAAMPHPGISILYLGSLRPWASSGQLASMRPHSVISEHPHQFQTPKGVSPLKDFPCKIQAPYHKYTMFKWCFVVCHLSIIRLRPPAAIIPPLLIFMDGIRSFRVLHLVCIGCAHRDSCGTKTEDVQMMNIIGTYSIHPNVYCDNSIVALITSKKVVKLMTVISSK